MNTINKRLTKVIKRNKIINKLNKKQLNTPTSFESLLKNCISFPVYNQQTVIFNKLN